MSAGVEMIIRELSEHATGGMEDLARELMQWVEDSGNVDDLDWALLRKEDVEGLCEALYGVASRLEDILAQKGAP